ncbi:hypothetical protein EXIGLDRAFT_704971 [Exidia glandulosa HHB12029]|uniref:Uncharacterized protein n=1 Tax=Exidia glandulosa HHB12029 TaxID=1314781 RepID=A0A165BGY7_EXIGL|nr:hypothetical protein EXIGLDRAFT_704971 [Exidia glandulosa HHB12029]
MTKKKNTRQAADASPLPPLPPPPPLSRAPRHPPPQATVDEWRREIVIEALYQLAQQREAYISDAQREAEEREALGIEVPADAFRAPSVSEEPSGPPSGYSPFLFVQYDPDAVQISERVQARWAAYKAIHPEEDEELESQPAPSPASSRSQSPDFESLRSSPPASAQEPLPRSSSRSSRSSPPGPVPAPVPSSSSAIPASSALRAGNSQSSALASSVVQGDEPSTAGKRKRVSDRKIAYNKRRAKEKKRCKRGGRTDSDGFRVSQSASILHNVQTFQHLYARHEHLATNDTPFTGPPPWSKDKVAYLESYDWESVADTSDLPKSVRDLVDAGYEIVVNDDKRAQIFTDANGKLVGVKIMPIKGVRWSFIVDSVEEQLAVLYEALGEAAATLEDGTQRTNGLFRHITCGISMGGGQTAPRYLNVRNEFHEPLRAFVEHPDVRIFAAHMGIIEAFKFWFPELFKVCTTLGQDLKIAYGDDFQPPYPDVPFFIDTANTGKQVVTPMHVDFKNALFGMCVIAVFGKFDHQKHGMLVLKELKLLVQLKHGDIIFIPSALVTHGNTELAPTDIRRSWTMFNSGVFGS